MQKKELVMEVDYYDLAWDGWTKDDIEKMFVRCTKAGIKSMFWSVATCGMAEYPSQVIPLYDGRDKRKYSARAAEIIRSYDSLAFAVELGKKYNIDIDIYFRMFDDYIYGAIDEGIDRIPHGWWESRCGSLKLLGWPDYWLEEVREYKMKLVREIASYGVHGFMFGLTRSHSLYCSPYRQPHCWGYNQTVADEYKRRYGVDIRRFDYVDIRATSEGHYASRELPFLHELNYVGAESFDFAKWQDIKGEGAVKFIRQVRKEFGPNMHIAIEASHYACPPFADLNDDYPAKMFFYPNDLAKEGLINEWVMSDNWRSKEFNFDGPLLPNFQPLLDAGAKLNIWMNDVFYPTGKEKWLTASDIREYLEKFQNSRIAKATLHELAFFSDKTELLPTVPSSEVDKIWHEFGQLE